MAEDIAGKYQEFIEQVAATKQVWALKSKTGWANAESAQNPEATVIPFWTERGLAKTCARDDWKSFLPTEISLAGFLEDWCMEMEEEDTLAGINWDARMHGIEVDAGGLALDILNRLREINSAIKFAGYGSIDEFITEISEEE
jgi:hypothetical protein